MVGRNFWNPTTGIDNDSVRYIITLLNFPPDGLWSTIPWAQSLGDGPVLQDPLALRILDNYHDPDVNGVSMTYFPKQGPMLVMLRTGVDPK